MEAGRSLDALVAEKVMGLTKRAVPMGSLPNLDNPRRGFPSEDSWLFLNKFGGEEYFLGAVNDRYQTVERDFHYIVDDLPHYSTSIADAWAVVEKLRKDGVYWKSDYMWLINRETGEKGPIPLHFCLSEFSSTAKWEAWWGEMDYDGGRSHYSGEADTAPHAICLAALKAVG